MSIRSKELGLLHYVIGKTQRYWDHAEQLLVAVACEGLTGSTAEAKALSIYKVNPLPQKLNMVETMLEHRSDWATIQAEWATLRTIVIDAYNRRNAVMHHHIVLVGQLGGDPTLASYDPKKNTLADFGWSGPSTNTLKTALQAWDHVAYAVSCVAAFRCISAGGTWHLAAPSLPTPGTTAEEIEAEIKYVLGYSDSR